MERNHDDALSNKTARDPLSRRVSTGRCRSDTGTMHGLQVLEEIHTQLRELKPRMR